MSEKSTNPELKELLKQRTDVILEYNTKKITEVEFDERLKNIGDKITEINKTALSNIAVEKKMEEHKIEEVKTDLPKAAQENIFMASTPTEKKQRKKRMVKTKPLTVAGTKPSINVKEVIKFLEEQGKPKDTSKEMKKEIINDLKILKDKISDLQNKIKKM
jgi:hypothetical protein